MDVEFTMLIVSGLVMGLIGFMAGRTTGRNAGAKSVGEVNNEFIKVVKVLNDEYGVEQPVATTAQNTQVLNTQWSFMSNWFTGWQNTTPYKKIDNVNVLAAINRFYAVVNDQQDKLQD